MNLKLKPYPKLNKLARYALDQMIPFLNESGIEKQYERTNYQELVATGALFEINELTIRGLFVDNEFYSEKSEQF